MIVTDTTNEAAVRATLETGRRGDLHRRRVGRRLQLGVRAVRRRAAQAGHHRPRRGHRPRKEAVARVRIVPAPASGRSTAAGSTPTSPNKLHQQVVNEPFATTELEGRFDVIARIHGGGITGQAGALRLGVARCAELPRHRRQPRRPQEGRLLTRDARVIERKKAGLKKARKAPQYSKR